MYSSETALELIASNVTTVESFERFSPKISTLIVDHDMFHLFDTGSPI